MALGLFDQISWLTNKVKKLCCIADYNQSVQTIRTLNVGDPIPAPTGNTKLVVYDLPSGDFGQIVNIRNVPGKEGQELTICLTPYPTTVSSYQMCIAYGVEGETGEWCLSSVAGTNCMTFHYLGGYWVSNLY